MSIKSIFLIIVFILFLLTALGFSRRKRGNKYQENLNCITMDNYVLIRDSPHANDLSKYGIFREKDKIRFKRDGYTLFWLELNKNEPHGIKLRGLDGYGIRDREFLKYTCDLTHKIIEISN